MPEKECKSTGGTWKNGICKPPNKYATKALRLWTPEEDEILKTYFHSRKHLHSSHQQSKFIMLKEQLEKAGFNDRTEKSISRRTFRLGLKSYIPTDPMVDTTCADCKDDIQVKERYFNREGKEHRCTGCQEKRNRKWDNEHSEQKAKYAREWRKQQK